MELIDCHAHLTDAAFLPEQAAIIEAAKDAGVKKIVCAGYDLSSSQNALELAKNQQGIFSAAGIHPENLADFENVLENVAKGVEKEQKCEKNAPKFSCGDEIFDEDFCQNARNALEQDFCKIEKVAGEAKVVAIGEIGLDYHFLEFLDKKKVEKIGEKMTENEKENIKNLQKWAFLAQIEIANKLHKPIVVHSRDAMGDTLQILKNHPLSKNSLLHCYSGSLESAKELMAMGFSFSFGGVVTFKNAKTVQEVVKNLPIERILLETDCPYMSPEPFRGQRNEPKNVVYVADQIARLKGLPIEDVCRITTQNAEKLFGI